jgi:hypothetical protein
MDKGFELATHFGSEKDIHVWSDYSPMLDYGLVVSYTLNTVIPYMREEESCKADV